MRMKRLLLCAAALPLCAANLAAYDAVEFKTLDGTAYKIKAEGLVITVDGGNLQIRNAVGEALTFAAADMASMQFCDVTASAGSVATEARGEVIACTVAGVSAGRYASEAEARRLLAPGVYVLQGVSGGTKKVIVEK